jgi:hypothetical protein
MDRDPERLMTPARAFAGRAENALFYFAARKDNNAWT